jgi:uncharacterized protein YaiL (DUF2058 family)
MVSSLKDALLQAGLKPAPKPVDERPRTPPGKGRPPGRPAGRPQGRPNQFNARNAGQRPKGDQARTDKPAVERAPRPPRDPDKLSLAEAYRARAQAEQREQAAAKREREAAAAAKRARQAAAEALLAGKTLNIPDAEDSRYLEYGRKIRRVYVTPEQNQAITDGELGIVQMKGRFLVVDADVARAIRAAAPEFFALLLEDGEAGLAAPDG